MKIKIHLFIKCVYIIHSFESVNILVIQLFNTISEILWYLKAKKLKTHIGAGVWLDPAEWVGSNIDLGFSIRMDSSSDGIQV